jgi:alpha-tubulin suppressor-like RCC1 family protein
MYVWGKGLRGQLGLGEDVKFSLAPTYVLHCGRNGDAYHLHLRCRLVPCFGSILKIDSGYAHNMCIAVKVG